MILILLIIQTVKAENINVEIFKDSFAAGDTVPLKITFNEKPLSANYNFNLIDDRNQKIRIGIISTKVSDKEYYSYFDIPKTLQKGSYKLTINNVLYIKNGQLVEETKEIPIEINNINPAFSWLKKQIATNSILENSLSILALKNAGLDASSDWLVSQQDANGCFPKGNCNVKDTAFALLALNSLQKDTTKSVNWLEGAQNSVAKGSWNLIIQSSQKENASCVMNSETINTVNGFADKSLSLSGENIALNLDCGNISSNTDIKVKNTYLGYVHDYFLSQNKVSSIKITNNGCFGHAYKTLCDYESTMYASYALKIVNKNNMDAIAWLKKNYNEVETIQHAFLVLLDNFEYSKNWLINNQKEGAWSKRSLIYNDENDVYTTSWVINALQKTDYINDAKSWILNQEKTDNWNDIITTATVLYLAFPEEKVAPALSFSPGIVSIYSQNQPPIALTLTNNGYNSLLINFKQSNAVSLSQYTVLLNSGASLITELTVNQNAFSKDSRLEFTANNKSYIIPIIKTSLNISSLTSSPIKFVNDSGIAVDESVVTSFNINTRETKEGVINIRNFGDVELTEVKAELTGDLIDMIKLYNPSLDKISINQTKAISLKINEDMIPIQSSYSGSLVVTTKEGYSIALPIEVKIKDYIAPSLPTIPTQKPQTAGNKTIAKQTEETKSSSLFWIVFFIFIILIAGFIGYRRFRKKKKLPKIEKPGIFNQANKKFEEEIRKAERAYKGL